MSHALRNQRLGCKRCWNPPDVHFFCRRKAPGKIDVAAIRGPGEKVGVDPRFLNENPPWISPVLVGYENLIARVSCVIGNLFSIG